MNLTLRKANAVQASINEAVKSLAFNDNITINEFENAETKISSTLTEFRTNLGRRVDLISALYEIRKAVSITNHQASIDSRLADIARLEKDIQFYNALCANKVRQASSVLLGKLEKIRNRKEDSYGFGRSEEVSTSIFAEEDLAEFRDVLSMTKKHKQRLQDELLEVNVRTTITLSDDTVAILQREGIV
jgi:hypothetical protein